MFKTKNFQQLFCGRWLLRNAAFIIITLIALTTPSESKGVWSKPPKSSPIPTESVEVSNDITRLVGFPVLGHSEVFSQALELLTSLQAAPSCNRLATSSLLTGCQSLESTSLEVEITLDDIRSTYAAQLALCELQSAGAQLPTHCAINFLSNPNDASNKYNGRYSQRLRKCLNSLESRPQWWTSYSNSKQNAVVLCQAARVELEKDDLIKLHKSMAQSSSKMEAVLIQTMEDVSQRLVQQREFATALESFQQKLLQDLESTKIQGQSHLTRLMKNVGSATENLVTRITSVTSIFEVNLGKLADVLQKTNNDAVILDQTVGEAFRRAAQEASELAEAQTKQWDDSHGLSIRLQTSLESINSQSIHELLGTLSNIQNQLQSTNHLIVAMHGKQNELSNRLNNLDSSFESLETKAQTFSALQTAHAEAQLHLYRQTQLNMQTTSERLAVIDASASSIGTKISNLSSLLAQLSNLFTVLSSVSGHWWQVLLFVAAAWFSRRLAAFSATFLGEFEFLVSCQV
ncbi:hypothetical protein MMC32_005855 [Xylographa parallela]|nr:hypothetical protein [Xylographa parallela]